MNVLVLRGLPGSGKSYVAQALQKNREKYGHVVVASADDYFMGKDGVYRFDHRFLGKAHARCFQVFLRALAQSARTVIVDNTNTTALEIAPYMLAADAYGYDRCIYTITPEVDVSVARNIHGCPDTVIKDMAEAMKEGLPDWWRNLDFASSNHLHDFLLVR